METWLHWFGFTLFVAAMLAVDLGVFNRRAHALTTREAAVWSVVWVSVALGFSAVFYLWKGPVPALEFLTGYLIELSLSVDNLFVFILIFSYFNVQPMYQHRVLFWGIVGAQIMRATLILAGAALIARFHWVIYLFGAFLIFTAYKMATEKETSIEPEANPVVRWFRRFVPVTERFEGQRFLVARAGRVYATPLLIVLLVVETTDLVFALDSIPAIFAVTSDPFIVYTSNITAILGLRSLYFLLAGIMGLFRYLRIGLALVLGFVGFKMLLGEFIKIRVDVSLGVVFGILALSVIASWLIPAPKEEERASNPGEAAASTARPAAAAAGDARPQPDAEP